MDTNQNKTQSSTMNNTVDNSVRIAEDSSALGKISDKVAENAVSASTTTAVQEIKSDADTKPETETGMPVSVKTDNKDIFAQFAEKIINEQESIIGPIAFEQALKVPGLMIDEKTKAITLTGEKKKILENLVKQYELLFGRVSIEICKEAVRGVIANAPSDQVPQILL